MNLTASFDFSGYSDYWHGMSDRGHGHGAAFAFYGKNTTVADLVDQWVEETWSNEYDFADLPESVTPDDIKACILESFTDAGRADYESGAVCEFSTAWAEDNGYDRCRGCGECVGDPHCDDCELSATGIVDDDDCEDCDDMLEYPVAIMEIDWSDHPDYEE